MMVWVEWVAFEDGPCVCHCGEHHAKARHRPVRCDGCGRRFTDRAEITRARRT